MTQNDLVDKRLAVWYIKTMKLIKARERRLKKFAKVHVTGKQGGESLGYFMSLEAVFDNADSDLQLIKSGMFDSNREPSDFQRLCDVLPGQIQDLN